MKSVLISIQPKWCELIASGKKTVEVRKTKPKIETPFKCYIYCTKGKPIFTQSAFCDEVSNGRVVGEFVCNNISYIEAGYDTNGDKHLYNTAFIERRMCIPDNELHEYLYKNRENCGGWAWRISKLVIYDEPRALSEFERACPDNVRSCAMCRHSDYSGMKCTPLKRPPQSWCYVYAEEGDNNEHTD